MDIFWNRPFVITVERQITLVCLLWIGLFKKYRKTLCCPSQILHKHCFQFLLGLKNNAYANFGGTTKIIIYGIFEKGLWLNQWILHTFMFPLLWYIQSVTKLIKTLRPKHYFALACFYLILSKIVQNTFQWYPSPLPPSHYCTACHKVCGQSQTTQLC